jgi:hypothetical protein
VYGEDGTLESKPEAWSRDWYASAAAHLSEILRACLLLNHGKPKFRKYGSQKSMAENLKAIKYIKG